MSWGGGEGESKTGAPKHLNGDQEAGETGSKSQWRGRECQTTTVSKVSQVGQRNVRQVIEKGSKVKMSCGGRGRGN